MIALPEFDECEERVKNGTASALDTFIYSNEPAGAEDESEFRTQLHDMLHECWYNAIHGDNK